MDFHIAVLQAWALREFLHLGTVASALGLYEMLAVETVLRTAGVMALVSRLSFFDDAERGFSHFSSSPILPFSSLAVPWVIPWR